MRHTLFAFLVAFAMGQSAAQAEAVNAQGLVRRYDAMMAANNYEARCMMTAHREDGTERLYKMRISKLGDDKMRLWFFDPANVRGQEMLRLGANLWVYMPNLKRALRMASRDSFQGGDFNNADVLRVSYARDYEATLSDDNEVPNTWQLELQAKSSEVAYDHIRLWMRKSDSMPLRGEYYAASGKLLRAAEFSDYKSFGGLRRPARVVMQNMLATARHSTMVMEAFDTRVTPSTNLFKLDSMGR